MKVVAAAIIGKAASLLLRYPDAEVLGLTPTIRAAVAGLPLVTVAAHRMDTDPAMLAAEYVELFDFRRRCCLYLTYYTAGDTRNRGPALVAFHQAYKAAGFALGEGELPDFLPAVLELAAHAGEPGWALLREHRSALILLRQALQASIYSNVIEAVLQLLPPARTTELAAAAALARTGPPTETVGLQPFSLTSEGRP